MQTFVRLAGIALLVTAFFSALGGVIAMGNGDVWIGILMILFATVLAVGGWLFWGYQRGRRSDAHA